MNKQIAVAFTLVLAGCATPPAYERPAPPVAQSWPEAAAGTRQATATDWRTFFPDARLQALIGAALEHNRDLHVAVARVAEARAQFGIVRADQLPSVNLAASRNAGLTPADLSPTRAPSSSQRYDAGLAMPAFELDFWGRVRSLDDAAQAAYLATEEARRALRLTLIADVANAYLALLEFDERAEIARTTLASREQTRALIAKRREVGLAADLDVLQADGATAAARAELANLLRSRAAAENALVLLVGQMPAALPAGRALAAQGIVADLAVGLPAEVLLARPDVLAAEQRLIAAHANVAAARAAFLPKIALTAALGTASHALSGLFAAGSGAWSFQPALSLPLFDGGRTEANADLAAARQVIAVAEYEKTLQQAFREVADLLTARQQLAAQLEALKTAAATQEERLKLAEARYRAGISSYLEVLDAQRESFGARQNAVQTRRALLAAAAQLYKALGGGEARAASVKQRLGTPLPTSSGASQIVAVHGWLCTASRLRRRGAVLRETPPSPPRGDGRGGPICQPLV